MKLECSVEELKKLLNKETSVTGTDVNILLDGKSVISSLEKIQNCRTANYDKLEENHML